MRTPIRIALLSLMTGCAMSAQAATEFSWNAAVTSDYVFRGVSQTDRDPTLQAGVDLSLGDLGFYIGAWGSGIDYGSGGPDVELDLYVGWAHDFTEELNLDLALTRYTYHGEDDDSGSIDYNELIATLSWREMISLTTAYTDDYGGAGIDSTYVSLRGDWSLGENWGWHASLGTTSFDGGGDYIDWNLGVSRAFGPVNASLDYFDTDVDGGRVSDAIVLTVSIEG